MEEHTQLRGSVVRPTSAEKLSINLFNTQTQSKYLATIAQELNKESLKKSNAQTRELTLQL